MRTIPYATQWIDDEDINSVISALRSPYLTQGPIVEQFEKALASYCGSKYAVALNSGTSALHAACHAAGIKDGGEAITSPITFAASANSVLYCGGKVVFVDVQEDTVNIDPKEIKRNVTKKTKAVIPVHFAGHPCDMKEIQEIAKEHGLSVIEDAAHALGATYKGPKIGSCKYSDMTVLSFHAVKHITTGEGGAVLTNDPGLYEKLLMFRTHGITRDKEKLTNKNEGPWHYEMQDLGFNYRITDFQCALGISQLKRLDRFISRRREIFDMYNKAFKTVEGINIPVEKADSRSPWHIYVIRVNSRGSMFASLREKGILVNVHYMPVYLHPYYKELGYARGLCPKAEEYYSQAITLPLYPKMTNEDVEYVIDAVKASLKG